MVGYGLGALLVVCVLAQVEVWPLSSFRLFSEERTTATTGWEVALVDGAGAEHAVPFSRLPRAYRGAHHLAPGLAGLPADRRDAVCRAWADAAAPVLGVTATEVRVYRLSGRVPSGDAATPPGRRTLHVTCAGARP